MKKVFLYEPDSGIFEIISLILGEAGYQVKALPDMESQNFPQKVTAFHPDLVLVDCFLDQSKPSSICKRIQSIYPQTALIALSCNQDIAEKYSTWGFDEFITKPFDIDLLRDTVERLYDRKQSLNKLSQHLLGQRNQKSSHPSKGQYK